MDMPAFNVKKPITKDQIINSDINEFIKRSFDSDKKIKKNTDDILKNPGVRTAVEKLSKE